jgi:hypothetical protein
MPFFETQKIEFLFVVIDFIINKLSLFLFDVSSSSGIIYKVSIVLVVFFKFIFVTSWRAIVVFLYLTLIVLFN